MATSETEVNPNAQSPSAAPAVKVKPKSKDSVLDKTLRLLSSVRFGVTMLGILLVCCIIGMLIMQVNVEGFQKYYQALSPAQQRVYGVLDLFDIYHAWYFTLLLAITGLNIILASIDRFPTAWQYVAKPKLTASPKFIAAQMFSAESEEDEAPQAMAERVRRAWRRHGFRARITEENNRLTVFAQRNTWNRLGAYVVHVALITIFIGGFLTNKYGMGGSMEIRPGKSSNQFTVIENDSVKGPREGIATLPFQVECRDLQQKLIRPEGSLDAQNTIDWLSYITIKDGGVQKDMLVHLNNVGDYRGYRFFQSQFLPIGNARTIKVSFEPVDGGQPVVVDIGRNESVDVPGIGNVRYVGFYPDFEVTEQGFSTASRDYNKPVAQLEVTAPDGKRTPALAFGPQAAEEYLGKADGKAQAAGTENKLLVGGNKVLLKDFEKVSLTHTLTVQYDPGRTPVYIGFTLLVIALSGVFFFAHQRVWAVIEPSGGGSKVYFGGNTNRNRPAFEGRFNSLVQSVTGGRGNE
ncbi:MAG: cytochrome c biogenesis protein ResB [Blastocatellia bacterium]